MLALLKKLSMYSVRRKSIVSQCVHKIMLPGWKEEKNLYSVLGGGTNHFKNRIILTI